MPNSYRFVLFLLALCLLTSCSSLPTVVRLPAQQTESRLFKVEQLDRQRSVLQASLLAVRFEPQQWRWVQTDPLGVPLARLMLTESGWKNDGFVMPNKRAQWLFSALATALNPKLPPFEFDTVAESGIGKDYRINDNTLWHIQQDSAGYEITLPDASLWRVEELH